jgi:hypothetical protein
LGLFFAPAPVGFLALDAANAMPSPALIFLLASSPPTML